MEVIKRSGKKEIISFDKITKRIFSLCYNLDVDHITISKKVIEEIHNNINTKDLDEHSARICASLITQHLDYGILADRIIISNNHKNTLNLFSDKINLLYNFKDINGKHSSLISKDLFNVVINNKDKINNEIDYQLDYNFDYFSFKTLEKSYLFKINDIVVERIQDMIMRVCLSLYLDDLPKAFKSYYYMSRKYFIHATPTLFNCGTNRPQLLSCFLLGCDDSIESIFKVISDSAKISKNAGGLGINVSDIREHASHIRGTNGKSNGIVPFLKVFNSTARAVNQGGKRNGSIAVYLQPHHPDILDFLNLKKNHGDEEMRTRDLFLALMIPDLFMERVKNEEIWSLFSPDRCEELNNLYGKDYEEKYLEYEKNKLYNKQIKARLLWNNLVISQIETGTPYILYKDHINIKSNQKNLGTIKNSNLCAEIVEYSDSKEYACCTLASISLPSCIKNNINEKIHIYSKSGCVNCNKLKILLKRNNLNYIEYKLDNKNERILFYESLEEDYNVLINSMPIIILEKYDIEEVFETGSKVPIGGYNEFKKYLKLEFDFDKLEESCRVLVNNLNRVIDINYYPVPETELSNKKHRPLGLGVQGLADCFFKLGYSFDSDSAKKLNIQIFETIYWASMNESCNLSKEKGPYESFKGSPLSEGLFQFDLWKTKPSDRYDWNTLRSEIIKHGVRNSLLVALMPTASTSQILGNNECFEPYTNNIYIRRTLAGDFTIINKHLIYDLKELNLWNSEIKDLIINDNGSIQRLKLPNEIKNKYKTAWELKQKVLVDMSADRGPFVCQTQSLNLFFIEPTIETISKALFYGWKRGLKTGSYYIRNQPKTQTQKFTLDSISLEKSKYLVCESCSG